MRIAPTDAALPLASDTRIEPKFEIDGLAPAPSIELDGARPVAPTETFASLLGDAVQSASDRYASAAQKTEALAAGQSDDLHGTMIAVKEAEISVKLVGSIRNKLIDAFHEIWRTSV
jgi:flagellar hook-basal body complex protein FliE